MRSVAANHHERSASALPLSPISIIHTSQTAGWSCRSMHSYPCAMPTSTFYMPDLLHSIFCMVPVCSANTKWSPIICARSPQSPGSDVSVCTAVIFCTPAWIGTDCLPRSFHQCPAQFLPPKFRDPFFLMFLSAIMHSCSQACIANQLLRTFESADVPDRGQDRHGHDNPLCWLLRSSALDWR